MSDTSENVALPADEIPWRASAHTQIWNVTDAARKVGTEYPLDDASLAVWLVHAPWMHIAWCWHYVGLVHLRDIPGQSRPPVRSVQGATHEFMVFAIDPDTPPNLRTTDFGKIKFLSPVSIVQQFVAANDAQALRRIEELMEMSAAGKLTLDSDGRAMWQHLLLECRS